MSIGSFKEVEDSLEDIASSMRDLGKRLKKIEEILEKQLESVQVIRKENQDELVIGTPGTGQVKVHGDWSSKTEFAERIGNAIYCVSESKKAYDEKMQNGSSK